MGVTWTALHPLDAPRLPPPPEPAPWCVVGEGVFRCETCGAETPATRATGELLYGFVPLLEVPLDWMREHAECGFAEQDRRLR